MTQLLLSTKNVHHTWYVKSGFLFVRRIPFTVLFFRHILFNDFYHPDRIHPNCNGCKNKKHFFFGMPIPSMYFVFTVFFYAFLPIQPMNLRLIHKKMTFDLNQLKTDFCRYDPKRNHSSFLLRYFFYVYNNKFKPFLFNISFCEGNIVLYVVP